ncbi:hypothetical protein [uncultured Clostridium sp.]|uniref:hypothetical protein n=1 Tax=uncultured Clostridium sp. TaxID=59620 RepID=UPI00263658F2|nr:hypothetical protein [uncultured Clostridium sp.]
MSNEVTNNTFNGYKLINNYIYLYHIDKFLLLPTYPERISDTLTSTFNQTTPLARSAPIFSYSHSGPRSMQITLALHRDLMSQINYQASNINLDELGEIGDDYVDVLIKQLQAIALPRYDGANKMVDPPMVALRLGNEIYIKGIVSGSISIEYHGPILDDNKYACVDVAFNITEVDPYDAQSVQTLGSFRGLNKTLERRLFK